MGKNVLFKITKLFSVLSLVLVQNVALSMYYPDTRPIDLKLREKPRDVSTYEWCRKRAREFVEEKKKKIQRLLGATGENMLFVEKAKKIGDEQEAEKRDKKYYLRFPISEPVPSEVKRLLSDLFANSYIKKDLQVKAIKIKNNRIVVERGNKFGNIIVFARFRDFKGEKVDMLNDPIDDFLGVLHNYGDYLILGDLEKIWAWIQGGFKMMKSLTGHELGHIVCEHRRKRDMLKLIKWFLIDNKKRKNISEESFNLALLEFQRAQEIEADIVGAFDEVALVDGLIRFFSNEALLSQTSGVHEKLKLAQHPSSRQRLVYLKQMLESMRREKRKKKVSRRQKTDYRVKINQATRKMLQKPFDGEFGWIMSMVIKNLSEVKVEDSVLEKIVLQTGRELVNPTKLDVIVAVLEQLEEGSFKVQKKQAQRREDPKEEIRKLKEASRKNLTKHLKQIEENLELLENEKKLYRKWWAQTGSPMYWNQVMRLISEETRLKREKEEIKAKLRKL